MTLSPERLPAALGAITQWRLAPDEAVTCPHCDTAGLAIIDRSSRPYAEWYALTCKACGLDETIQIPLGPPVMGGIE